MKRSSGGNVNLSSVFMATFTLLLSLSSVAALNYVAPAETEVTRRTGNTVALAGNKCVVCHGPAGPPLNSFGADLQAVAGNLGYGPGTNAGWVNGLPPGTTVGQGFQNLFEGAATEDSDGDTYDNVTELGAGSNPGVASSIPGATSNGGGGGGDTEILSPRNLDNRSKSTSTLSGCGQAASLDPPTAKFSRAEFNQIGLYALLLLLPLSLLTLLRTPKHEKVPLKKPGPALPPE
jgi:hypothetical protein